MKYDEILENPPFSLCKAEKRKLLNNRFRYLTSFHKEHCHEYRKMLDSFGFSDEYSSYENLPFLPVRLFKELDLKSVPSEEIIKTMTSSGTTGQQVSKIFLDRSTAFNQQKTMVKIVSDFIGSSSRMPMIILDCPSVLKDRYKFSARGAAILGFSLFGSKKIYAFDDDMNLDLESLKSFIDEHKGEKIFLFGFTYIVWQYFYKSLQKLAQKNITLDLTECILIHGGGWKKLQQESVSHDEFKQSLNKICNIKRVYNYYGMVEQTGCIYMECEHGHLHCSSYSDVITRRASDFSECDFGEKGIVQVLSPIPESYPGHSLLTEDEGVILGEDDCPCGRKGKYFEIQGRISKAEIRGCSDTFEVKTANDIEYDSDSIFNRIEILSGSISNLKKLSSFKVRKPFDSVVTQFCESLSGILMASPLSKEFPDVFTFGFWLRKSSVANLRKRFLNSDKLVLGRGTVFHIAPSNVPVNYAYSLFSSLLCGNVNVVRVSSKRFPQVDIINHAINELVKTDKFKSLAPFINIVRYDRDKTVNDYFSSICNVRVVWGGNNTINDLRQSLLSPRAKEITFADRYSIAIIDSDYYNSLKDKHRVATDFYNDTYLSDQNACTSPMAIIWTGTGIDEAKKSFWKDLLLLVKEKYHLQAIQSIDKLTLACKMAALTGYIDKVFKMDNYIYRVQVNRIDPNLMSFKGNSGYFFETECSSINEVELVLDDNVCQSVAYLGDSTVIREAISHGLKGVDRIVKFGHTLDFDFYWDGYNLFEEFTRTVDLK
ncbi:acyl-CoA reductase [uncultured Succinivibrio sp.]|uniref:LuxE/PaaK family acyltransferase n=1 Tax=uncultured Succinivibrio sp. TaxID=540749 RepID=UPI0025F7A31A|nr:acyl-CoA reductase [uncultured Succinivibrio sp.]